MKPSVENQIMDCIQPFRKKRFDDVYLKPSTRLPGLPEDWEEFTLKKCPRKLLDFISLLGDAGMKQRCVWFTKEAFVEGALHPGFDSDLAEFLGWEGFWAEIPFVGSYGGGDRGKIYFTVQSTTIQAATECFNRILELAGDSWVSMDITMQPGGDPTMGELYICPVSAQNLRRFYPSNPPTATTRRPVLECHNMNFSAEQCRVLVRSNFKRLQLSRCGFLDGGTAFVEECVVRQELPTVLHVSIHLPFALEVWEEFVSRLSGKWELMLYWMHHLSDNFATPAPAIRCLTIFDCRFHDDLGTLTAAVEANRGPKFLHLRLGALSGGVEANLQRLVSALANNTNVEGLSLDDGFGNHQRHVVESLMRALRTNETLRKLKICVSAELSDGNWCQFLTHMSTNSSLLQIGFSFHGRDDSPARQRRRIRSIKEMLMVNKEVEEIHLDMYQYERDHGHAVENSDFWKREIEPRLARNRFRKKFDRINREPSASVRAALLGEALEVVTDKPGLLFLALQRNQGTVVSRIQEAA